MANIYNYNPHSDIQRVRKDFAKACTMPPEVAKLQMAVARPEVLRINAETERNGQKESRDLGIFNLPIYAIQKSPFIYAPLAAGLAVLPGTGPIGTVSTGLAVGAAAAAFTAVYTVSRMIRSATTRCLNKQITEEMKTNFKNWSNDARALKDEFNTLEQALRTKRRAEDSARLAKETTERAQEVDPGIIIAATITRYQPAPAASKQVPRYRIAVPC